DADALNICGKHRELLALIPENSILTPHPKEFERLTEKAKNDFHQLELLRSFCQKYKVYVTLKGSHTAIGTPDGSVYFYSTGNPGMATGGTGDVLTGVLTALISQKYDSLSASLLGVYLHGLAGNLAAEKLSQESLIASDVISHLSDAFKSLY
ncbi:MAG: NAD(P)H-hydrate dehydratase, partial [Cyclobacteriaceae bacterium]